MRIPTLLIVTVLSLVMLPALQAEAVAAAGSGSIPPADGASASKKKAKQKKAKRKRCKKGYALKTVKVKRKGKTVRVKRCRKKPAKRRPASPAPKSSPAPEPQTGTQQPSGTPRSRIEGEAARALVQSYLANSRFTDCPTGWPSCFVEEHYSHFGDPAFTFTHCRLTPGGPTKNVNSTYAVKNAVVEVDGSWAFDETIPAEGDYKWQVAADGTATGTYLQLDGPPAPLNPMRHVPGARACNV